MSPEKHNELMGGTELTKPESPLSHSNPESNGDDIKALRSALNLN